MNIKNINSDNNHSNKRISPALKIKKNENESTKTKDSKSENYFDYFQFSDFNDYQTMKELKTKYNFYHSNKLEIEDINTRYFILLRNIIKNNPGIELHKKSKESQIRIKKIKSRYILRTIKK